MEVNFLNQIFNNFHIETAYDKILYLNCVVGNIKKKYGYRINWLTVL